MIVPYLEKLQSKKAPSRRPQSKAGQYLWYIHCTLNKTPPHVDQNFAVSHRFFRAAAKINFMSL
ncbi:hypothetical protein KSP40_PGU003444 [Platanthera guangdongensis]|uniref:Ycf15 n=1 Tax=Platanthera guangdongensis TaxID=2320717 RepID=A0ABR2M718_9ASPA